MTLMDKDFLKIEAKFIVNDLPIKTTKEYLNISMVGHPFNRQKALSKLIRLKVISEENGVLAEGQNYIDFIV